MATPRGGFYNAPPGSIAVNGARESSRQIAGQMSVLRGVSGDGKTWLAVLLLGGIVVLACWPCLDNALIRGEAGVVENGSACDPEPHSGRLPSVFVNGQFQPLTYAVLHLDRALWGLSPRAFHTENLALHALNCVLVYLFGLLLFTLAQRKAAQPRATVGEHVGAGLAALLFGLHPLRVEAVTGGQHGPLLGAFFLLVSLLTYVRVTAGSQRGRWQPAALVCYALSLAAGPAGVALPILLVLLDVYPLRRLGGSAGSWFGSPLKKGTGSEPDPLVSSRNALTRGACPPFQWTVRSAARGIWLEKVPFLILSGVAVVVAVIARTQPQVHTPPAAMERLAQVLYGPGFYALKTLWPVDLVPLYETHWPPKWASVDAIGSLAVWVVLIVLLIRFGRQVPAFATACAAYVVLLLPVPVLMHSGYEAASDRYSYLPSVVWMLLAGGGLSALWSASERTMHSLAVGLAVAALLVAGGLGVLTWQQCHVWRDPQTLWACAAERRPESSITLYRLAQQFEDAGELERAQQMYAAAINCRLNLLPAYHAQGEALLQLARPEEAVDVYRRALRVDPRCATMHYQLGVALAADNQLGPAEDSLARAIALDRHAVAPRSALGHLLMIQQRWDEAATAFRGALALQPRSADLEYDLGQACRRGGHVQAAVDAYRRALAIDPKHALARRALAEIETSQPTSLRVPG